MRFQSTPAHQDGRNGRVKRGTLFSYVSIHSRPPGREKPTTSLPWQVFMVSIHSRPPGREKRSTGGDASSEVLFQSTPAHQDGRNIDTWLHIRQIVCFNPLPPTRTGET